MEGVEYQPHILLKSGQVPSVAIVVGDPARAKAFAETCESHKDLAKSREYHSFEVNHKGETFMVISHGVGASGAAICFNELIKLGVKCIIRAGTCGSLQANKIKTGDVCVVHSCAKEDGTSKMYEPEFIPAVTDIHVMDVLRETANEHNICSKPVMAVASDVFYAPPHNEYRAKFLELYEKVGVEVIEMEISALFTIARQARIMAGAIVAVDGCILKWDEGEYSAHGDSVKVAKLTMGKIALDAAAKITREIRDGSLPSSSTTPGSSTAPGSSTPGSQ